MPLEAFYEAQINGDTYIDIKSRNTLALGEFSCRTYSISLDCTKSNKIMLSVQHDMNSIQNSFASLHKSTQIP